MRTTPIPVPMPDGRIYEVHPMGHATVSSSSAQLRLTPRHRVYERTGPAASSRRAGKPLFHYSLRRVTDEAVLARVVARLAEMHAEAKRDAWRERVFGKRLVAWWRWVAVFLHKARHAWTRTKR
jgi:hypothetical protein